MTDHSTDDRPDAGLYEIRLAGQLDARWAEWFDALTLSHEIPGMSVLRGVLADQAELHGVLQRVRDLGLPLVSVLRLDREHPTPIRTQQRKDTDDDHAI